MSWRDISSAWPTSPTSHLSSKNIHLVLVRIDKNKTKTQPFFFFFFFFFSKLLSFIADLYSYILGLTPADLEINDLSMDSTSNGIDGENEKEVDKKEEEAKEDVGSEQPTQVTTAHHVLTPFELEGLWNLVGKLEELPAHKKGAPAGIGSPEALLEDLKVGIFRLTQRVSPD